MKEEFREYLEIFKKILNTYQRPKIKRDLDQFIAREITVIKRAILIRKVYKKVNGKILFLEKPFIPLIKLKKLKLH